MEIGDDIYVFDTLDKLNEYNERVEKARVEVKENGFILFYMEEWYQNMRSPKAKMFYKNTITKFKPMELGGAPVYKPHYVYFVPFRNNEGKLLSRCKTSNAEEVAFLDMKKGVVREVNRELSTIEKMAKKIEELESKVEKKEKPEKEVFTEDMQKAQEKFEKRNKKAKEKINASKDTQGEKVNS